MYIVGGLAVGIGAGLAAAMLLDPKRGQERRAQIARLKDQVGRQVADRSRELTTRAKAIAAERGIGQPAKPDATDAVGITTGRDMVPVMPVGEGPVTDPSSTSSSRSRARPAASSASRRRSPSRPPSTVRATAR